MSSKLDNDKFFRLHLEALSYDLDDIATGKQKLRMQIPDIHYLTQLVSEVTAIFAEEPALLELEAPIYVVGDLHGHLLDLYRIIKSFDLPPGTKYLFLGDYVDRGEFSMETLFFVYILKVMFPKNVYLIRGNHEFRHTSMSGGLWSEIEKSYPRSNLFEGVVNSFNHMPLAATIGKQILCLHGGLCPELTNISQIASLKKPIMTYDGSAIMCGMLWSDPTDKTDMFVASRRGTGFGFGERAVRKFMKKNNLNHIIRGHECVDDGFHSSFKDRVMTVFSASNYCGMTDNKAAVIHINDSYEIHVTQFHPFKYLKRKDVIFGKAADDDCLPVLRSTMHSVVSSTSMDKPMRRGFMTMSLAALRYTGGSEFSVVPQPKNDGILAHVNLRRRRHCHIMVPPILSGIVSSDTEGGHN